MISNIQEHHSEEEIETIRLQNEVRQWKLELDFVAQEIEFYLDIFNSSLIKRTEVNRVDAEYLFDQFQDLREVNYGILKTCQKFLPRLDEMNECDDIQCDHAFINAHIVLRKKIEKHLNEVRNIKYSAFCFLKDGIEKFLD